MQRQRFQGIRGRFGAFCAGCLLLTIPCAALAGFMDQFIDKEDGWIDGSDWLLNNSTGFLPIPLLITEPAVGGGLGLAALFFHPPKDYDPQAEFEGKFVVPNISAAAAGATSNGSWLVGGGHFHQWKDDAIRYEGLAGYADMKLTFYAPGSGTEDVAFGFNSEGLFLRNEVDFRIGGSKWFLGGSQTLMNLENTFQFDNVPGVDPESLDATASSLELVAIFEDVDSRFTPGEGVQSRFAIERFDNAIGSDFDFWNYTAYVRSYWAIGDKLNLGVRVDGQFVDGNVPFFLLPFVQLRGIPALRYQGENVVLAETELRWSFHPRIGTVVFLGLGKAANAFGDLGSSPSRVSKGIGIRYFAMRKLGAHFGIDVARGPEDTHFYLTFGSAW